MPPVVAAISSLAASIGTAIGAISGITIGGVAVGSIALQLGASLVLSAIAQRLMRRRIPQQDIKRELAQPQSKPPKRHVYGRARIPGSPIIRVKGNFLYMCLILNSRPSHGGQVKVFFDGREAQVVSGNMLSFTGGGAILQPVDSGHTFGSGDDRPRVWLGLGDQTGPPDALRTHIGGGEFLETDGWRGLTVMWVRIGAGPSETRVDRWPRTPPEIEVEADWSKVWDLRDANQDPDDPATWEYSNNQALCLLDAILHNPIRARPRALVDLDSFSDGADLADETVSRNYAGGSVPRYTANGILVWRDAEIVDQVQPLADAGAGDLVQIGGRLGYSSGAARATSYTITDILEDGGLDFQRLVPGSELPVAVKASYVNPDRDWQDADLPALAVGAGSGLTVDEGIAEVPLPFVTEPTQAMRIQKIVRNKVAAQRRLTVTLPPDAIDLVPGAVCEWGIPELPKLAGRWRVQSIHPAIWLEGEGVAMRCPVQLVEEPDNLDAWNPEADEFELATETFTPPAPVRVPPDDLDATTGPGAAVGSTARIRFDFLPVEGNVIGYEWQWRIVGSDWTDGGSISADIRDGNDRVFGFLSPVQPGEDYEIRVRTIYLGALSGYTVSDPITAAGPELELDPPQDGQATGGQNEIVVSFRAPNSADFLAIEFWGSLMDELGAASLIEGPVYGSPNATFEMTESGLGDGVTRWYWARSVGPFGAISTFAGPVSATTDP